MRKEEKETTLGKGEKGKANMKREMREKEVGIVEKKEERGRTVVR